MITIRLADHTDITRQKDLWQLCFGDPPEFIDLYYRERFDPQQTLLLFKDGQLSSMLTMLPAYLHFASGPPASSMIIYAVATHPHFRNQGLAGRLIDAASQLIVAGGFLYSIIVPAQKTLFDFYRRLGYHESFVVSELSIKKDSIKNNTVDNSFVPFLSAAEPQQYLSLRESLLNKNPHVSYYLRDIVYQKSISRHSGADIHLLHNKNSVYDFNDLFGVAAIEIINENKVIIKDLLTKDKHLDKAIISISKVYPANEYIVRTPAFSSSKIVSTGSIRCFAMIRSHSLGASLKYIPPDAYMGLAFD